MDRGHPILISCSIKLFIWGQTKNVISLREFRAGTLESCRHVLLLVKTNKRVEEWDSGKWEKTIFVVSRSKAVGQSDQILWGGR